MEEGEAEIREHGPEHWFSKWEQQCRAEAEQDEQLSLSCRRRAGATAMVQLYKDQVCQQPELSLWIAFQNAATAVTSLYKESVYTYQQSFDTGIQIGYQLRNKDVLALELSQD